ncbi:DUF4955 domain-containing protein [Plasmodiophora brassicae]
MCAIRATEARVSHIMSTSAARVLLLCLVAASVARPLRGQRVWDEFYESRQRAPPLEATLPDYSYAGYRYSDRPIPSTPIAGRPVFNVADYGAVADDDVDDAAGIQSAIDACARSDAGGVIQLNVGRYTVSSNADRGTLPELVLHGSHCVLRGVARNLTNIVIQHHKVNRTYAIRVGSSKASDHRHLASVTRSSRRETFNVSVDNARRLHVGQTVALTCQSPVLAAAHVYPLTISPSWTRLVTQGMRVYELHTIADLDATTGTVWFQEPLHVDANVDACPFVLRAMSVDREIGLEDLTITGRWDSVSEEFIHHASDLHDSGWAAVQVQGVRDSWLRRIDIVNCNEGITIDKSIAVTVEDVAFTGKRAHLGIIAMGSYGVLMQRLADHANHLHGFGVGFSSAGTVIRDSDAYPGQTLDMHGGLPYATLHEQVRGGKWTGNGGKLIAYPNHGRWLTIWNCVHDQGHRKRKYDVWPAGKGSQSAFALPIIVGVQGSPMRFVNDSVLDVLEYVGEVPPVASLFESQLSLRQSGPA